MPSCGVQAGPPSGLPLGGLSGFGFWVPSFGLWALGFGLWVRLSASTTLQLLRRVRLAKARLLHQKAAHFPSLAVRAANPLELLIRPASLRGFRYGFDSSQARKTVRRGRFWGLLFAPEKRAKRGQPDACLAADGPFAPQTGASLGQLIGPNRPTWRNQALPQSPATPGFRCRPRSQAFADFATGLIAAKPVKSCDGGVFGLLKGGFFEAAGWQRLGCRAVQGAGFAAGFVSGLALVSGT